MLVLCVVCGVFRWCFRGVFVGFWCVVERFFGAFNLAFWRFRGAFLRVFQCVFEVSSLFFFGFVVYFRGIVVGFDGLLGVCFVVFLSCFHAKT